jgi:hypothetical protein
VSLYMEEVRHSEQEESNEVKVKVKVKAELSFVEIMMMVIWSFKDDMECGVGGTGGLR